MSKTSGKSVDLTPKPLTTISGHEGAIWNMAYLPRGTRIVTCSWDETVRIWDVENGKQEGTSMKHGDRLFGLAVTRDGKRILSGGDDKRIRVWDAKTHKLIEEWRSHTGWIFCIAISPDDHLAASGDHQGEIVIRKMAESGEITHSIDAGSGVRSLCFSPNGERLACAVGNTLGEPGAIHVYGVESGELVLGPIKGHEGVVNCVVWSLDGSQLFSASYDCTIRCWDSEDGKAIGEPWMGHTADVGSISLSPDGTKLASASDDKSVRFWDARSGAPNGQPLRHGGPLYAVTFSPSGEFVASGGHNEKVSIWCVPQWDDSQKQARNSSLDLSAVPAPKDRHQGEFDLLDVSSLNTPPASHRPFISSSRPPGRPADLNTVPIVTRIQRFWRGVLIRRPSLVQQAVDPQRNGAKAVSPAPTAADEADPQDINLQLKELVEQQHHQLSDTAVAKRKADPERDRLEKEAKELRSLGHEARQAQHPRLLTGSSSAEAGLSSYAEPSRSNLNTGPSTHPKVDTPWNLNDIRSNFAHDITGYVVRDGEEPFASGSFGDIYRGKLRLNGRSIDVAVKAIRTYSADGVDDHAQSNKRLRRELRTWVNLEHVNVLPLFGTTMNFGRFPAMVCPWLENGSLTSYLERRNDTITTMERLALLGGAAAGLQYLHSQSVVHGDLSGSNVLIDDNGRACISDFGLSMLLTKLGGSTCPTSRHIEGTLRWAAPELLDLEVPEDDENPLHVFPTPQSDVYSFGRIMLQVLTGKIPYHYYIRDAQVLSAILKGVIPQRPNRALVTDRQWIFMQRCWMFVGVGEPRPGDDEIVEFVRQELVELERATS